jgi:1,2-diacylglycerol 3-alpha-glucosyltransferase
MKIVMICDFYDESLEYQENLLVKYYLKHGHQVTVITSACDSVFDFVSDRIDPAARERTYEYGGAKIIRLAYRINFMSRLRMLAGVERVLTTEQPDLIFVHDIMPNVLDAISYLKHHPRCRMIIDFHADYSNSGKNWLSLKVLHGIVRKWLLGRARKYAQRIFPIVPASATFLHEVYGVPHAEMELLPLGADIELARVVKERGEGRSLRRAMGIGDCDIVIFTGGKLAPAKRTELLIEAYSRLSSRPHLVIVGDSTAADADYKAHLLEAAKPFERVHFTGWLNSREIYSYLDMADLAVFPASQSILWQQAIGMGLPLIVGDTGHQDVSYLNLYGNIHVLRAHEIGAESLAAAIGRLINDANARQIMAAGACRVADEVLNWDRLIQRTLRWN